jgi:hypothetical protein
MHQFLSQYSSTGTRETYTIVLICFFNLHHPDTQYTTEELSKQYITERA